MNTEDFHKLVHVVTDSPLKPPHTLFDKGFDDWHCRARLAHFLAMPEFDKKEEAIELFRSIVEIEVDEEQVEAVEEKVFALQRLSSCLHEEKKELDSALHYSNLAIELAESTDFLYKYILRGELWADRWARMHALQQTREAEAEIDEKIDLYQPLPIKHNSYLYYGYRFKAQLAAERGVTLVAKDFMHMALSFMEIPEENQARLEEAFAADHDNASWILNQVDLATPAPDKLHWDI
jgi:tetratricopeptide (TPR) repeat protein